MEVHVNIGRMIEVVFRNKPSRGRDTLDMFSRHCREGDAAATTRHFQQEEWETCAMASL